MAEITDRELPEEFRSANSVPVERATIKRDRMIEILAAAVEADRQQRGEPDDQMFRDLEARVQSLDAECARLEAENDKLKSAQPAKPSNSGELESAARGKPVGIAVRAGLMQPPGSTVAVFDSEKAPPGTKLYAAQAQPSGKSGELPVGWREQFKSTLYERYCAMDNQDFPLEDYPSVALEVLESVVGPRHPTVVTWRNDAIRACIATAYRYCRDPDSFQYLKQDLEALITAQAQPVVNQQMTTEREAFEFWASDEGKCPAAVTRTEHGYLLAQIESYWAAWQARAALAQQPRVSASKDDLREIMREAAEAAAQDREDAARLDWLDQVAHCADWFDGGPTKRVIRADDGAEFVGDTWREAIDAARAAKEQQ